MKKVLYVWLAVLLSVGVLLGCTQQPSPGPGPAPAVREPIVLKAVSFLPAQGMKTSQFFMFIDRVTAQSKGEFTIRYMGGPEAIPQREQPEALIAGVVDLLAHFGAAYESRVPEVALLSLVKQTAYGTHDTEKERKPGGVYDYVRKAHERAGMYFLGRQRVHVPFWLFSKKEVRSIADIAKLNIASGGVLHTRFIEALGGRPISITGPDTYTALERGTVDASGMNTGALNYNYQEVAKYVVMPPYKTNANNTYTVNLNTWNRLPKHLQDVLQEAAIFSEFHSTNADLGETARALSLLYAGGMRPIEVQEADRERYQSAYDLDTWRELKEKMSPQEYDKMRELAQLK